MFFKLTAALLSFSVLATANRELEGQHNWGILLDNVTASFGPNTDNSFLFTYDVEDSVWTNNTAVYILEPTCENVTNGASDGLTADTPTVDALAADSTVSVDFSTLGEDIWEDGADATSGVLSFCFRLEAKSGIYVIN